MAEIGALPWTDDHRWWFAELEWPTGAPASPGRQLGQHQLERSGWSARHDVLTEIRRHGWEVDRAIRRRIRHRGRITDVVTGHAWRAVAPAEDMATTPGARPQH